MKVRRNKPRTTTGAVTIELAVTLPLLLILLLGGIDAGQFAKSYQIVSNASRECARIACRAGTDSTTDVETRALNYLASAFPSVSQSELQGALTVTVSDAQGQQISGNLQTVDPGDPVSVQVSLGFDSVRIIPGISQLDNRNVAATTFMCRQ